MSREATVAIFFKLLERVTSLDYNSNYISIGIFGHFLNYLFKIFYKLMPIYYSNFYIISVFQVIYIFYDQIIVIFFLYFLKLCHNLCRGHSLTKRSKGYTVSSFQSQVLYTVLSVWIKKNDPGRSMKIEILIKNII